jgi:2-oxopent-4-enoate/cis-2-oxohex-4-enoate hydratase
MTAHAAPPGGADGALGLTPCEHQRLADVLLAATRDRHAVEPLTHTYPELTLADAGRIRDAVVARRVADGERLIGAKVSLSPEGPRLGLLTDAMLLAGGTVDPRDFIAPRVEAKLAFLLADPAPPRLGSAAGLVGATLRVAPCLEIVDSRYGTAPAAAADDIADNCAASVLLIGEGIAPPAEGNVRRLQVEVHAGEGAPMRAPACEIDAVSWLAREVGGRAPDLGRVTFLVGPPAVPAAPLRPGSPVTARFGSLGRLELRAA